MLVVQCDACGKQVGSAGALTWSLYHHSEQTDERTLDFCAIPCIQAWASARLAEPA